MANILKWTRRCGDPQTHTEEGRTWRWRQRLEWCSYKPRKVKDCQQPPCIGETDSVSESPERVNPGNALISGFASWLEIIHFWCFLNSITCGNLLQSPRKLTQKVFLKCLCIKCAGESVRWRCGSGGEDHKWHVNHRTYFLYYETQRKQTTEYQ